MPLECICRVRLLGCLGMSTFELMTDLTHHTWLKSHRHMLGCSACGGPTINLHYIIRCIIHIKLHSSLPCSLDILGFMTNLQCGLGHNG